MNTPAEIPKVQLLGRPVKPLAIGLLISLFAVMVNAWYRVADSAGTYDRPLSFLAAVTFVVMVASWVRKQQRWFEWSLLMTAGVFTARAFGIALMSGMPGMGILPFAVAVLAGGSYVLERADDFHGWER